MKRQGIWGKRDAPSGPAGAECVRSVCRVCAKVQGGERQNAAKAR